MNEHGVALGESEEALKKITPVRVVAKDITTLDPAADDVIPAVFDLNANGPRHSTIVAKHPRMSNIETRPRTLPPRTLPIPRSHAM